MFSSTMSWFQQSSAFFFFFPALCSLSGWQLPYISTHLLWMKKADKPYFFSKFCQGRLTLEWRTRTSQLAFKDICFHVSEDFCLFLVFGLCDGKQWFPMLNQSYICIPFAHVVNLYCVPNIREFWSTFFSPRKLLLLWDKGGYRRMS